MMRRAGVSLVVATLSLSSAPDAAAGGIPVVAAPWLDDIALASVTSAGAVIYVNIARCKEVGGNVCSFVRYHEVAHVKLNHGSSYYTSMFNGRALAEAEADCYAAKNALLVEVKAAVAFFEQPWIANADIGDHGTGLVRAKRIKACRGLS